MFHCTLEELQRDAAICNARMRERADGVNPGGSEPGRSCAPNAERQREARLRYLTAIAAHEEGVSMVTLRDALGARRTTANSFAASLIDAGLITDEIRDFRKWMTITPAGRDWLAAQGGDA